MKRGDVVNESCHLQPRKEGGGTMTPGSENIRKGRGNT